MPYYLGRAGGELFLLKRINRERYEQMRDKFEKQEFLAIMVPAMMPPPMPVKLFEFAAGVFEMKPLWFFCAILVGKFLRFLVWAIITIIYGPADRAHDNGDVSRTSWLCDGCGWESGRPGWGVGGA